MKKDSSAVVTDLQLREAEEGLVRLLHSKRFPREWIERHVPEAMAQARADFAARLAAGREDETVNLLVVIGYRRALKLLSSQTSRPATTSLETVFHLADESTPTPEEEAIERDREERVAKAMSHLPERERKLMALVYYKGMSIRAAGRRLGWGKSVANRHHQAALERLNAMLDRSLLAPEIAIPAFVAAGHRSIPKALAVWIDGASETTREVAALGANRIGGVLETGNAAAMSGAGRAASGVCGAVVVACIAGAASGVVGPGVSALTPSQAHQQRAPSPEVTRGQQTSTVSETTAARESAAARQRTDSSSPDQGNSSRARSRQAPARARPVAEKVGRENTTATPSATAKQTVKEFGIESGSGGEPSAPGSESPTENTPIAPQAPAPQPRSSSSGSSSDASSSGSGAGAEFGM